MIYEPRCIAAGITINDLFRASRKVFLRRGEMMQVVSNLIVNAIYAMSSGGTLSVSVYDTESPAEGVDACHRRQRNEASQRMYFRKSSMLSSPPGATVGTGIGLFVAKQFVEGHGGQISIESMLEPERHGTLVRVFLPVHTQYEAPGT